MRNRQPYCARKGLQWRRRLLIQINIESISLEICCFYCFARNLHWQLIWCCMNWIRIGFDCVYGCLFARLLVCSWVRFGSRFACLFLSAFLGWLLYSCFAALSFLGLFADQLVCLLACLYAGLFICLVVRWLGDLFVRLLVCLIVCLLRCLFVCSFNCLFCFLVCQIDNQSLIVCLFALVVCLVVCFFVYLFVCLLDSTV